jgi:alpha-maltose-1-phosphate synthase
MKIGFVTQRYYPNVGGGGEISLKLLTEELQRDGHLIVVISFDSKNKGLQIEKINGVTVFRYKSRLKLAGFLTLIPSVFIKMRMWQSFLDIYHIYGISPIPGASIYKLLGGKRPVVATLNSLSAVCPIGNKTCSFQKCRLKQRIFCLHIQDGNSLVSSVLYSLAFPFLTKLSQNLDWYIALTESVKVQHVYSHFESDHITVIPNFYERSQNSHLTQKYSERISSKKTFDILYVGTVIYEKGLDILIKAFFKISQNYNQARLVIVGTGKGLENYVNLVEKLGLKEKVVFKGQLSSRKELFEVYLSADVFVHPVIYPEAFGRTLLEAMSFNIPTIVSNMGSLPQTVGKAGLVFKSGDENDLARKIEILINDKALKLTLSNNTKDVIKQFNPDYVTAKIIEIYKKVSKQNEV